MLRFIKTFWIALLATAAMVTSCVRIDAGTTTADVATLQTTTLNQSPPVASQ
jgi:hypothetical protein